MEPECLTSELELKLNLCLLDVTGYGNVLLLGDSMLARFQPYGTGRHLLDPAIFQNVAIGGSTTNHWIWLLQQGKISLYEYNHIVVMLGTNNVAKPEHTVQEIVTGLLLIMKLLLEMVPKAKIHFVPIFPRWDLQNSNVMEQIAHINRHMATYCENILDPFISGSSFFEKDQLHLNLRGYELFAQFLNKTFTRIA